MNNKVLIVGSAHHNTLGLVESLGQKGIKPYVILNATPQDNWLLKSKYVEKGWITHDNNKLLEIMIQNFSDPINKTIVLVASDKMAVLLDENYESLAPYFIIPTVKENGSLSKWMSKQKMVALAHDVGLDTPETWVLTSDTIPQGIVYPCITKAISSVEGSKSNLSICKNRSDLAAFLKDQGHCKTILVSQYIEKIYEFQFLGCSLNSGEDIIISGRTHIDRPNNINNTYFLKFDKVEEEFGDTINKVKRFIKETGYSGVFSVEFLRGQGGKNYFTEMNFRNDGNAICQTAAGINIPYIYYLYYSGGDYLKELQSSNVKTTWLMPELFYFKFFLKREFGFKEWLRNMKKATCYTTYFSQDKAPFFAYICYLLKGMLFKSHAAKMQE